MIIERMPGTGMFVVSSGREGAITPSWATTFRNISLGRIVGMAYFRDTHKPYGILHIYP